VGAALGIAGVGRPRIDAVHGEATVDECVRERRGHLVHGALADGVGDLVRHGTDVLAAGEGDQPAAGAGLAALEQAPGQQDARARVDGPAAIELLDGHLGEALLRASGVVGDDDVDASEALEGGDDEPVRSVRVLEVLGPVVVPALRVRARGQHRDGAAGIGVPGHLLIEGLEARGENGCAVIEQAGGQGRPDADAARDARDQGHAARQRIGSRHGNEPPKRADRPSRQPVARRRKQIRAAVALEFNYGSPAALRTGRPSASAR
jgi:hypothetical protein